jgi:hypothetical protein
MGVIVGSGDFTYRVAFAIPGAAGAETGSQLGSIGKDFLDLAMKELGSA